MPKFNKSSHETRKEQRKLQRKMLKGKKPASEPHPKKMKHDDEEITSDEDENIHDIIAEAKKMNVDNDELMYEEEEETPQEKKLRMAKEYLAELEKIKEDNSETGDIVAQKLKEDRLEADGQLRKLFADSIKNISNIKVRHLRNKWQSLSLTCVVYNNNYLYTGSKNGTIIQWTLFEKKIWLKNNYKKQSIPGHKAPILCLAVSSDGKFMASGCSDGKINIWNAEKINCHLKLFESHRKAVTGLSFQRGTHTLFSCSEDRSVNVWNIDILSLVENCGGHAAPITGVDSLSKESCITSGGSDKTVIINIFLEDKQVVYNSRHSWLDGVKLLNDKTFITFGQEGSICLWVTGKKLPVHTITAAHGRQKSGVPYWITAVATLINTDLFASGSMDGLIKFWKVDMDKKKMEVIREIPVEGVINSLDFTPEGSHLFAAVGQEHRLGEWFKVKVKNSLAVIELNNTESNKMEE